MDRELIVDGILPKSEEERLRLWEIRESFEPEKKIYDETFGFDVSLKIDDMDTYVEDVRAELGRSVPGAELFTMGHIGDNNIHFSVAGVDKKTMEAVYPIVYEPLRNLNGSVSAEHGIGLDKKPFLNVSRTKTEIDLMRQIKRIFDPNNIMNPGKVFDP